MSHPPGPIFHGRYLHSRDIDSSWDVDNSWSSVGTKEVGVGKHLAESFPEMCRSVFGNMLLVQLSTLENRPRRV